MGNTSCCNAIVGKEDEEVIMEQQPWVLKHQDTFTLNGKALISEDKYKEFT